MRYQIVISLDSDEIPKDKNRMFLSFLKHHIAENDKRFFEKISHFRYICRNVNSLEKRSGFRIKEFV